jgi:hypothetical protein
VGTSTFTLLSDLSDSASTLVLNEDVIGCHPGNSGNPPGWQYAVGHPGRITGSWSVCSAAAPPDHSLPSTGCGLPINPSDPNSPLRYSTGVFSTLTGGSGTDSLQTNGAILTAAWSGTVTFP